MPSRPVGSKRARCYAGHMLGTVIRLLAGCTGSSGGADFTLNLTPVISVAQDPFEGVDQLDLVIVPVVGESTRLTLGAPTSGSTPSIEGLPSLQDARILVEGYEGGTLVMRGRTEPLTATEGTIEAEVFVASTEATAWLGALPEALHHPMVAPLGDGHFWIAGGVSNNRSGAPKSGTDAMRELSLAPPGEGLAIVETGTLPAYTDADGVSQTERMGGTATLLTVAGTDAGKILVTGGSITHPFLYDGQVTDAAGLYDPTTGEWEDLGEAAALRQARSLHVALENVLGNVVIWGGLGVVDRDGVLLPGALEFYDRAARRTSELDTTTLGHLAVAITDLGAGGTALCGGALLGGTGWSSSPTCVRVPIDGAGGEDFSALPVGLAGGAMVTLDDGRILLTGGATTSTAVEADTYVAARSSAWLYNPSTGQWGALSASMAMARAGHRMALLDDGRVAIFGGAESFNPFFPPTNPVSCVELYDPPTGTFSSIDGCTAGDDAGGLPGRAYEPQIAYDPDYGVLVVGGLDGAGSASAGLSLFVPGD